MYPQSNRNFESNKMLGGVGAILTAIGSFVPFTASIGILFVIGIILVLVSMRGLSDDFQDRRIFGNAINGFIFSLIGIIVGSVAFGVFISTLFRGFITSSIAVGFLGLVLGLFALLVAFIFLVISAISYRRAFDILADHSGEKMFRTGGLLFLIGAGLVILFGLGFILMFVAWLLLAVAFFSMRLPVSGAPQAYMAPPPPPTGAPSGQVKYCQYCGAENNINGTYCTHCGRRLT